jgi:NADH pyrophosphatase NudC (nudix superfamily)
MNKGQEAVNRSQELLEKIEALAQPTKPPPPEQEPAIGDIRALKHRIHELEGEVIGYKQILDAQQDERNFCPRCGKRTADLTTIHTCTPPKENT